MDFSGSYVRPDFAKWDIADQNIQWDKATIVLRTSNVKSIKNQVTLDLDGKAYRFEPTLARQNDTVSTLETGFVDLAALRSTGKMAFKFNVDYNGSRSVAVAPIGKTTTARMVSDWHSPSFGGNYIPEDKDKVISAEGFKASWQIIHLNRPFAQQSFDSLPDLRPYAFAVDFVTPVDQYQQNERAAKYGFLVIGLTFLVFFLIQSFSKIAIHIFQYSMIGLALVMFYTLLISITEHSSFTAAYLIAGSSVVVLIGWYARSILKSGKFSAFIALSLTALYSFIYVIIQLEDHALLVGSIGLFLILAAVMYVSRKIDWSR
jgi:inner membrane protein